MTNHNRALFPSTGAMVGYRNGYDYRRALREFVRFRNTGLCDGVELMMLQFYYDKLETVAFPLLPSSTAKRRSAR